jgi:hypothetical protein
LRCSNTNRLNGEAVKRVIFLAMKYWEIIADNITKAGWSWGCV